MNNESENAPCFESKCGASKVERIIRILAGSLVLLGIALWQFVHPYWIALPIFVGANLLQSGFTKICPAESILKLFVKK